MAQLTQERPSRARLPSELTERRAAVLRLVVEHCMQHSSPVGSQTIAAASAQLGSPATIRKELAWLEAQGYLLQPHTSAGRVPTELGYRCFVDSLMGPCGLGQEELRSIKYFFGHISAESEQSLKQTSQLLSDVTHCASIVLPPRIETASILSVQLVELSPRLVLLVTVLSSGSVEKQTLELSCQVSETQLSGAQEILCRALIDGQPLDSHFCAEPPVGRKTLGTKDGGAKPFSSKSLTATAKTLNSKGLDLLRCAPEVQHIVEAAWGALHDLVVGPEQHVFIGGASELAGVFEPSETLREILAVLEQHIMVSLLRDLAAQGVTVCIGAENQLAPLRECALVVAPYAAAGAAAGSAVGSTAGSAVGSVAVIGPKHMNYPKAMASVEVVSDQLSHLLSQ